MRQRCAYRHVCFLFGTSSSTARTGSNSFGPCKRFCLFHFERARDQFIKRNIVRLAPLDLEIPSTIGPDHATNPAPGSRACSGSGFRCLCFLALDVNLLRGICNGWNRRFLGFACAVTQLCLLTSLHAFPLHFLTRPMRSAPVMFLDELRCLRGTRLLHWHLSKHVFRS